MNQSLILKSILTWGLFIPVAISNGIVREVAYKPLIGDLAAHQVSTVIAIAAFMTLVYLLRRNDFRKLNSLSLFVIGFGWMIMTILFEFGFGFYIDNASLSRLLGDYDIFKGRVWSLMLLAEMFTPLLVKWVTNYT